MRLDVQAVSSGDRTAIAAVTDVCGRIAKAVARKFRVPDFADDLAQELTIIVVQRLPAVYDGQSEIEPFVWEAARRLTLAYLRRSTREQTREDAEGEEGWQARIPDEASPTADAWAAGMIDAEQAQRAKAELIQRIRTRAKSGAGAPRDRAAGKERWYADRAYRPVRRVWDVRRRLGWTQRQMAAALHVPLNRFRQAEQAGEIPPEWQRAGADLLEKHHRLPVGEGPDLVRRWTRLLGLKPGDVVGLAQQIGVHRSTVFRWNTGRSHPPGHVVLKIEAIVQAVLEVRRKRVKEALGV